MNFGEIVEPTTRAITEDDYENYPDNTEYSVEWQGSDEVPTTIETLVFIETDKIIKIFKSCIFYNTELICEMKNGGVKIFSKQSDREGHGNIYIVTFEAQRELTCGQVVKELSKWIERAQQISTITSSPLASYQTDQIQIERQTVIKMLSTNAKGKKFPFDMLEIPNLITGLGACVLSFCVHTGKECTSFIAYMDSTPIDSINSHPVLCLASLLDICAEFKIIGRDELPSSNLYI